MADLFQPGAFPALMDPRSMGILAAAFQGLNASGPSRMPVSMGQVVGQAGLAGLGAYQGAAESQRKAAQTDALIDMERQKTALTKQQVEQAVRNFEMQQAILRKAGLIPGAPTAPIAPGGALGAPAPQPSPGGAAPAVGVPGAAAAPSRGGFPFDLNQITAMRLAGMPDLLGNYKESLPNISIQNGLQVDPRLGVVGAVPQTNQQGFSTMTVPDPTAPGGFRVMVTPGAAEAYGTQQKIAEGARADADLVTVPATSPTEPPRQMRRSDRLREVAPQEKVTVIANTPNADLNLRGVSPQQLANAASRNPELKAALGAAGAPAGMSPAVEAQQTATAAQQKDVSQNYGQIFNQLQNASMQNPARIAKLQHIGELLNGFEGGRYSKAGFEVARAANSLGFKIDPKLPNKEAAESLASAAALELRNPTGGAGMPGAMSDADREYLKGMTPNMAQTDEGRKKIIDAGVRMLQRENQIAAMARSYRQRYGKVDEDFFNQLQEWSNRNPVFGSKK